MADMQTYEAGATVLFQFGGQQYLVRVNQWSWAREIFVDDGPST